MKANFLSGCPFNYESCYPRKGNCNEKIRSSQWWQASGARTTALPNTFQYAPALASPKEARGGWSTRAHRAKTRGAAAVSRRFLPDYVV